MSAATQALADRPHGSGSGSSERDDEHLLPKDLSKWPASVKYIMGNEMCERFSFYGLRTILAIYLNSFMGYSEDTSTAILHSFIFTAYAFPLLGGYLADSLWGRFKTIFILSLIYACGNVSMAVTAIPGVTGKPPHWWGILVSLFLVALGTGGIKPNVSAFVGDQFQPGQERLLERAFAMFYLCINVGSLASTFITPILREKYSFDVAFAVPAALMIFSLVVFVFGKSTYVRHPPGENMVKKVLSVVWEGYSKSKEENPGCCSKPPRPMLSYAVPRFGDQMVKDTQTVGSIGIVLVPLIMFWALWDQHSSRWVFQAERMNRNVFGYKLLPDQIPILNPLMLVGLIPLFDRAIYPALTWCGVGMRPLTRIRLGTLLTAGAFFCAGLVELANQGSKLHVAWQIPQYFLLCCGEILVSITGLEFAFTQAPKNMKSVIMALWLLTTAIGNLIVVVVAEVNFIPNQAYEFFFFSALMIVAGMLFTFITWGYVYRDRAEDVKGSGDSSVSDEVDRLEAGSGLHPTAKATKHADSDDSSDYHSGESGSHSSSDRGLRAGESRKAMVGRESSARRGGGVGGSGGSSARQPLGSESSGSSSAGLVANRPGGGGDGVGSSTATSDAAAVKRKRATSATVGKVYGSTESGPRGDRDAMSNARV